MSPQQAHQSTESPPAHRHLRGYALDPSLAQRLDTAPISQVVFKVPWEPLQPGPVGEYIEVVDFDPAGKCFYEPVDLDDPHLLAQDGLPPSEGTPKFHQQMVYAVAQLTIQSFEHALGRAALWSPGPPPDSRNPKDDSHYVGRLRIYPHALREANAYYSPSKKALLFGYFPASTDDPGEHIPGGMVFTCLSHDIIAHETAHALLDGLHRRLNRATNPDMLAFHEAFADIVALFQHFTFPEILRHQIAQTRGDIRSQENLLGQLASQFGRTTGVRGALRDAIGRFNPETGQWEPHQPDPMEYETTIEPHLRGAILVATIFDAFLSIYNRRVADLIRLYTGGSGVLPAGAVHPDLVHRLADEASRAAGHVLTMCVRALDYCPPVDLTFGEFLRALITADIDLVPDDDRNYRVAFVEAFRRRGLYPRDVRTLSVENLRWRTPEEDDLGPSAQLLDFIQALRERAHRQLYTQSREKIFQEERATRAMIHGWLSDHFRRGSTGKRDAEFLGLDPDQSFEVHQAHFALRTGPDGDLLLQLILQLTQDYDVPLDPAHEAEGPMRFEGGSTVVVDLKTPKIAYCIRKPIGSTTRRARQRAFLLRFVEVGLRGTYFGVRQPGDAREPFALLHRGIV
ncbi:MAG TPA: hypothetical protein VGR37_10055 [Longimicrobiaceae bacterium]|nr:hypothetical protein [Longimicrobiaceae bacterium]